MAKIIQISHPGSECDNNFVVNDIAPWNTTGTHHRKFLKNDGMYVDQTGEIKRDQLLFWGEWEPNSNVKKQS
jgi:hypothetical protein